MGLSDSKPSGPPVVNPVDNVKSPKWTTSATNTKVYFDIAVGDAIIGRVEMVLAKVYHNLFRYTQVLKTCCNLLTS